MKRLIAFICIAAILLGISGCGKTEKEGNLTENAATAPCVLKEENGKFYLQFSESSATNTTFNNINAQIAVSSPTFSSFADLKNSIETGSFSKANLEILQKRAKNGILEIPDPSKLHDVALPAGLAIKKIVWEINSYDFSVSWGNNQNYDFGFVTVDMDGGDHDYRFNENFINYTNAADSVISDRIIEDRNAREFVYTNSTGKYKQLLYQLENNGETLYVVELYCLEYNYASLTPKYLSDTIPLTVQTFCKDEDVSWCTYFEGFEERPSVDWLKTFGIKEITD